MSSKPIVGYWDVRGIGQAIRHLLVYLGVDFVDKRYENGSDWFNEKYSLGLDFPNLPYYIEGDLKLTQSLAILRYLARKHQLNGNTVQERIRISMIEQQVTDLNIAFFKLAADPNCDKLKADYLANLPDQIKMISDYLGEEPFVAGANISYVDFWLYEFVVKVKVFAPELLNRFDNLARFVGRIESLHRLSSYIKKRAPSPFGGPSCRWNGSY